MNTKPRADSRLKTLPAERQAAIAEYAAAHKLAETVKWLREDGLQTNLSSLSEFLSWHGMRQTLVAREQKVLAWLECEKLEHPELSDADLFQRGQRKFQMLSIAEDDPYAWAKIQKTARDREKAQLEDRRLKLLEAKAAAFDRAQAALTDAKKSKGGITQETLKRIEQELNLL